MQPGEMIANAFAFLLLAGLVGGIFLVFGRPLWPDHGRAQMVILLPVDPATTGSVRRICFEPCLPPRFDLKLAPPRPQS
ncbi:polymerase [Mesorhizobium sp. B1-1-8]|uniref:polymerase n=1 Tax=Mesorhizobium sp. B1-1-8 TaxID=2589976 RepID=UPI00112C4FFB|nr:polymerase [Mesorhizobium sp. B1-1-8]UCI06425.1 polymerase [Mesorhizobium sp. B1-1-8]